MSYWSLFLSTHTALSLRHTSSPGQPVLSLLGSHAVRGEIGERPELNKQVVGDRTLKEEHVYVCTVHIYEVLRIYMC